MEKYALIIQCAIAHNRCSGFACTESFYERSGTFKKCDENTKYISFTCGGCCGKGVAAKIEHFGKKLSSLGDISRNEVTIHLASCMTTDNHHYDRCPHIEYIKDILQKKGFNNIIEGSYLDVTSTELREAGIYHKH